MSPTNSNNVSVRYMIDDVDAAVAFIWERPMLRRRFSAFGELL
jgi:hypothetical protein